MKLVVSSSVVVCDDSETCGYMEVLPQEDSFTSIGDDDSDTDVVDVPHIVFKY